VTIDLVQIERSKVAEQLYRILSCILANCGGQVFLLVSLVFIASKATTNKELDVRIGCLRP